MSHEAKIVRTQEVNDEYVSYTVRCCDDPLSDSVHTSSVLADNHDEELKAHIQRVQDKHEKKHAWRKKNELSHPKT